MRIPLAQTMNPSQIRHLTDFAVTAAALLMATVSPDSFSDSYELPPQCIQCIEPTMIAQADSESMAGQLPRNAGPSGSTTHR